MDENVTVMKQKQPPVIRSFKVMVQVGNATDWVTNGLRFSDEAEALRYAEDLSARWVAVKAYDVRPDHEEPNASMLRFGSHVKADDEAK